MMKVSAKDIRAIKRLYRRGYTDEYIAKELGKSVSFVKKYIKKLRKENKWTT